MIVFSRTTIACALKMFGNCATLENDPSQVNFIKLRIQCAQTRPRGWAKHINEIEMLYLTSREPTEPIEQEGGDLADLEDVLQFEEMHDSAK